MQWPGLQLAARGNLRENLVRVESRAALGMTAAFTARRSSPYATPEGRVSLASETAVCNAWCVWFVIYIYRVWLSLFLCLLVEGQRKTVGSAVFCQSIKRVHCNVNHVKSPHLLAVCLDSETCGCVCYSEQLLLVQCERQTKRCLKKSQKSVHVCNSNSKFEENQPVMLCHTLAVQWRKIASDESKYFDKVTTFSWGLIWSRQWEINKSLLWEL